MHKSPKEIFEVLGSHFSEALAEPEEVLQTIIEVVEKYSSEDRYESIKHLGEGGIKKVSLERDRVTRREVAVSMLSPNQPTDEVLRFINEAYLTARLGHNNIVPLYDFGRRNNEFYFTTKYLYGDTFEVYLFKNKPHRETLSIFISICEGISYAHSQGIVHLDIKPSNVQISSHSEVIIFDWGLARDLDSGDGLEGYFDERFAGSPGYTAPEQILSQNELLDEKTDIYSLGAVLYHIFTGEPPWKNPNFDKTLQDTLIGDQNKLILKLQKAQAPESLIHVCLKAMANNKTDRYDSVDELKNDVNAYLNGFATKAEDASYFKMLFLLIKRHKIPFVLTVAFLVALGVTLEVYNEKLNERQTKIEMLNGAKAEVLYDQAENLYNSSDLEQAEKILKASLELKETSRAKFLLARILIIKGCYLEAKKLISKEEPDGSGGQRIKIALRDNVQGNEDDFFRMIEHLSNNHMPGLVLNMVRFKYSQIPSLKDKISLAHKIFSHLNNKKSDYTITVDGDYLIFKANKRFSRLIPLAGLPFKDIDISNAITYNIESLNGMKTLKRLNLSYTSVDDLSALNGLNLDYLNISNTCIVDMKPLKNSKIKFLDARGLKLRYLTSLKQMLNIEKVMLDKFRYTSYKDKQDFEVLKKQNRIVNE